MCVLHTFFSMKAFTRGRAEGVIQEELKKPEIELPLSYIKELFPEELTYIVG